MPRTLCSFLLLLISSLASATAVDEQSRSITLALSSEPPTLNSMLSTNAVSFFVLGHIMEGLLQYNPSGELIAGVAERWQLRDNGATFWLRKEARWSDGKPVTAADFVFAWRNAIQPATGSQYAFIFYPLKNAQAINEGELPASSLGVTAVGDYRLEVEFDRPCPYFLSLTAFMSYFPVREDFFLQQGERFAADSDKLLYNGPFTLNRWIHGAHLTLDKNPHYWQREKIALNRIDIPFITGDKNAIFNLFQDNAVALADLDAETTATALERAYPVRNFHTGAQYFLEFNFRQSHVTANKALRKAVQAIFDPSVLTNKVLGKPGNFTGVSLFPRTVKGVAGRFRDEYPPPHVDRSLSLAHQYLAEAKSQLGVEQLPALVLLAGDSPRAAREAEYLQYLLQQGLGLDVRIDAQTFKQYIEKMTRGDFDIAVAGWGPDFDDAITYGDLFASWNKNNRGHYRNEHYDYWVSVAQRSTDQRERMAAMNQLQQIISDDVVIIPTFERGEIYVQHPQLTGVVRLPFSADPNFRFARIVERTIESEK